MSGEAHGRTGRDRLALAGFVVAVVGLIFGTGLGGKVVDGGPDSGDTTPARAPPSDPGKARDADGDGVPDTKDGCPKDAGPKPSGCTDRDGDGVADVKDHCTRTAGPASNNGCPLVEACTAPSLPATFEKEIENADDRDRFPFCTGPKTGSVRARLTFTGSPSSAAQVQMVLKGPDGRDLRDSGGTGDDGPASLQQNVRPDAKYTIEVSCYAQLCSTDYGGSTYRVDVTGGPPF